MIDLRPFDRLPVLTGAGLISATSRVFHSLFGRGAFRGWKAHLLRAIFISEGSRRVSDPASGRSHLRTDCQERGRSSIE